MLCFVRGQIFVILCAVRRFLIMNLSWTLFIFVNAVLIGKDCAKGLPNPTLSKYFDVFVRHDEIKE